MGPPHDHPVPPCPTCIVTIYGPHRLEYFKDRDEVWASVSPVAGTVLDTQQRLRKGLLRGAKHTPRGLRAPWWG